MPDLRQQLSECFQGRTCWVGLGDDGQGDDGLGLRLAASLQAALDAGAGGPVAGSGRVEVVQAGVSPERHLSGWVDGGYDRVVFLDAVDFGAAAGTVVLLGGDEMASRYPQVSTHRLSLGLLARMIEAGGRTRCRLLGVQPDSLKAGHVLSRAVEDTVRILAGLWPELLEQSEPAGRTTRVAGNRPRPAQERQALGRAWHEQAGFSPASVPQEAPC